MPTAFEGFKSGNTIIPVLDAKAQNGVIANTKLIKDTVGWSGKNKCPNNATAGTYNGITRNANTNGSLTFSGTASANEWIGISNANLSKFELKLKAGVTYIMSSGVALPSGCVMHLRGEGDEYLANIQGTAKEVSYTPSADINCHIGVRINNGTVISNAVTIYPMLRDADILDSTYEPYFGSTAVDWSSYAKTGVHNLIPINSFTGGTGITATINEDKSVSLTAGTVTSELVCPATINAFNLANTPFGVGDKLTFTIGNNKKQSSIELQVLYKVTSADSWTTLVDQSNVDSVSFTVPQCEIFLVRFRVLGAVTATTLYPMLIFTADTDPTYAPYAMTNKELTEKWTEKEIKGTTLSDIFDTTESIKNANCVYNSMLTQLRVSSNADIPSGAWTKIGKLKKALAPAEFMYAIACNDSGVPNSWVRIYTTGEIQVYQSTGNVQSANFGLTYFNNNM